MHGDATSIDVTSIPLANFASEDFSFFGVGGGGANWCPRWIHRLIGLKFLCIARLELRFVGREKLC